jgi:hypothetical protein
MSNSVFDRNIAPIGYIDLRPAITSLRRRMFVSEIPEKILEAAETNVKLVGSKIPIFVSDQPQNARDLQPMDLLADSLHSSALTMFIYAESQLSIIPVPAICTCPVLEKAGFLSLTGKNVAFRFRNFYPRQILDGLNIPRLEEGQFEEFGLCLRERKFDEWLAATAHRMHWPLDAKPRRGVGRPKLVPLLKPILKELIDGGRWQQGMPLKLLVALIQAKFKDAKVDRETVKHAMNELYKESRLLEYRYVPRKRRTSTKPGTN